MIAFLRGTIRSKTSHGLVVEVRDVGYVVRVPAPLQDQCSLGETIELHTHEVIRDTHRECFGVSTPHELALLQALMGVSGVGPKSALGILSLGSPQEIEQAIANEDAVYLSKVVGVGRKTAERVVVELKAKMQERTFATASSESHGMVDGEVMEALVQLGYKVNEVRDAIRTLPKETSSTEDRLKAALQTLAK
jgi:holliday junction DNA helicase RuvA